MLPNKETTQNNQKKSSPEAELLLKAGMDSIADGLKRIYLSSNKIDSPFLVFQKLMGLISKTKVFGNTLEPNNK